MSDVSENTNFEKFLIFSVLGKLYSFPSNLIGEIAMFDTVYPLPLMPSYVLGVINRYSYPYALFDTGLLISQTPGKKKKIIVIKNEIDQIAFLIDEVASIVDIPLGELSNIENNMEINDFSAVVCSTFNWNENNVFVLDISKIIERVTTEVVKTFTM